MKHTLQILVALVLFVITLAIGGCSVVSKETNASTEEYPSHQIKVIVPFGVGGGVDTQARALKKVAAKYLQQPLVIYNKPGGGGNIGLYEIAKSKPDGYTLGASCPEVVLHSVYGAAKHHYLTDLEPLAQVSSVPFLLVVNVESPWNSVEDLIQYGKTTSVKFSHSGIGSITHVIGELFGKLNHIRTLQVPFKSSSEQVVMLLGKHVDASFISTAAAREHIQTGKLRVLASTGSKRLEDPLFANAPTLKELGIDIVFTDWFGIATSKPLPSEIKAKLTADLKKIILDPELKTALAKVNAQVEYLGPEESQEKWIQEAEKLKKAITETGVLKLIKQQQGVKF